MLHICIKYLIKEITGYQYVAACKMHDVPPRRAIIVHAEQVAYGLL